MRFSFLVLAILASCFFSACSPSKENIDLAKGVCTSVTNENWNNSNWLDYKSSKDLCEHQLGILLQSSEHPEKIQPCVFGGLPFFCVTQGNGDIRIFQPIGGSRVVTIKSRDIDRTASHLVILK